MQQFYSEERLRTEGRSGVKSKRFRYTGTRPFHSDTYSHKQFLQMTDKANLKHTIGMGEIHAVLNGLEFRTRHADYGMYQPSRTSKDFNAFSEIPMPDVPPEVLDKETTEEQMQEMRLWFRAWKDQDDSVRDFRKYFKPVMCYLEGQWNKPQDEGIKEPYESDISYIIARNYSELHRKARWMAYTGSKNNEENYSFQPTSLIDMIDDVTPVFAQWNYQIRCHPLSQYVYTSRFRLVDDIAARVGLYNTKEEYRNSRGARFQLNPEDENQFDEGHITKEVLDELMEEIPGKDNYGAFLEDTAFGLIGREYDDPTTTLNAANYHRWFIVDAKGANGNQNRHRGFADTHLFMAMTSQDEVITQTAHDKCEKDEHNEWVCSDTYSQKWSYAIPLEIIYLTPLAKWNPYNIRFSAKENQCSSCTGGPTVETAYTHASDKEFYLTPSEFFTGKLPPGDGADSSGRSVGMLDANGDVQFVRASGVHVIMPEIEGVGMLRQRYPIAPVHQEGDAVWKELEALKALFLEYDTNLNELRDEYGIQGPECVTGTCPKTGKHVYLQMAYAPGDTDLGTTEHTHEVDLRPQLVHRLTKLKQAVIVRTGVGNGHSHELTLRYNTTAPTPYFYTECDGRALCWDRHGSAMTVVN